jgi:hypothetical protein
MTFFFLVCTTFSLTRFVFVCDYQLSPAFASLDSPLGETASDWIVHGFTETDYLATYPDDPSQIYGASDLNKAMMNAFMQTRKFLMAQYDLTEYESWTIITQGADFGITQVVDGMFMWD